jgi:hypothetical protein
MSNSTQKNLSFMEASGKALKAAQDLLLKFVGVEKRAQAQIDGLCDRFINEQHLAEPHEREKLAEMLSSHDTCQQVIGNLLTIRGREKVAFQQKLAVAQAGGEVVPDATKEASASGGGGKGNGFRVLGQRTATGEKRASDESLRRLAGLST